MIGSVAGIEDVLDAEIPILICGKLVADDDAAANRTKWVGVKVEEVVEVILCRQGGIEGELVQKFKGEFGLGEKFIP